MCFCLLYPCVVSIHQGRIGVVFSKIVTAIGERQAYGFSIFHVWRTCVRMEEVTSPPQSRDNRKYRYCRRRILFYSNGVYWKVVSPQRLVRHRFLIAIISLLNDESLKTAPAFPQIQSSVKEIAVGCSPAWLSVRPSFLNYKPKWIRFLSVPITSRRCSTTVGYPVCDSRCSDEGGCGCGLWQLTQNDGWLCAGN